jgi:hypothetical protein
MGILFQPPAAPETPSVPLPLLSEAEVLVRKSPNLLRFKIVIEDGAFRPMRN